MTVLTLTERDVLNANASIGNISTFSLTEADLVQWKACQAVAPKGEVDYLISARGILTKQAAEVATSPMWLGRVKSRLQELAQLPVDWDTYGGVPADPRIVVIAEKLMEWFAVDGVPPPDVFASGDGGVQLEWHIGGVDATIAIPADEESTICYHDLNQQEEPWSGPASEGWLRVIRRRLLQDQ